MKYSLCLSSEINDFYLPLAFCDHKSWLHDNTNMIDLDIGVIVRNTSRQVYTKHL